MYNYDHKKIVENVAQDKETFTFSKPTTISKRKCKPKTCSTRNLFLLKITTKTFPVHQHYGKVNRTGKQGKKEKLNKISIKAQIK